MPIFEYKGVGRRQTRKGMIEADSSKVSSVELKQKGVYPTEVKEKSTDKQKRQKSPVFPSANGVKMKNPHDDDPPMATLVKARIPLDEALRPWSSKPTNSSLNRSCPR